MFFFSIGVKEYRLCKDALHASIQISAPIKNVPEFKVGDLVTYKPYEQELPARVKGINTVPRFENDNRVFYELTGAGRRPVVTNTTGLSIMESTLFKPYKTKGKI